MIEREKTMLAQEIIGQLENEGILIAETDLDRPWGGFYVINPAHVTRFAEKFFSDLQLDSPGFEHISGKILLVAPNKRLSWQYHQRRNEIWRVVQGNAGVVSSENDEEHTLKLLEKGDLIVLPAYTRHRLVGLEDWAIVAEIWQHTELGNLSNEQDIVRIQDDFNRLK